MSYSLLDLDDYDRAPLEPHRKFAVLEQTARRRMTEIMEATDSGSLASELRTQYMSLMVAMSEALGIPGISYIDEQFPNQWEEYQAFALQVQRVVARIMLNEALVARPYSVQLATATKQKIESQIIVLRGLIEQSDMPPKRRSKLIAQLDDFAAELNRPRLNYAAVALVATTLLAGIQGATSTLADAPSAYKTVGTILKWIGQDKEAEEQERERLGAPPLMLPNPQPVPRAEKPKPTSGGFDDDFDDVPF